MKIIEEAAKQYSDGFISKSTDNIGIRHISFRSFKEGAGFSQRWIPIIEEQPPEGIEIMLKNEKWINEDFNPKGIRAGHWNGDFWTTAYWWNYQDCYTTRTSDEDDNDFEDSSASNQIPTHWRPIELN